MAWAGALVQPKKTQTPLPWDPRGPALFPKVPGKASGSFGRSGSKCLKRRVSGAFLRRLGTVWRGQGPAGTARERARLRLVPSVPGTPSRGRGQLP